MPQLSRSGSQRNSENIKAENEGQGLIVVLENIVNIHKKEMLQQK